MTKMDDSRQREMETRWREIRSVALEVFSRGSPVFRTVRRRASWTETPPRDVTRPRLYDTIEFRLETGWTRQQIDYQPPGMRGPPMYQVLTGDIVVESGLLEHLHLDPETWRRVG